MALKQKKVGVQGWSDWVMVSERNERIRKQDAAWPLTEPAKCLEVYLDYPTTDNPKSSYFVKPENYPFPGRGGAYRFSYPNVNNQFRVFGWQEVVDRIKQAYAYMYEQEGETSEVAAERIPGMLNRGRTTGEFGLWGHDITDLVIEEIWYIEVDHTLLVHPGMGS